jgi:hypothetical protein
VEALIDLFDFEHGDRVWTKVMVEGIGQLADGARGLKFEMGDLSGGVDAGIRAPGALDHDRLTVECLRGAFQRRLNGRLAILALPAIIGAAIIFD